ncbi:MAG: hypothetical protein KJ904_00050 [Alphaproteobacteria bacterium]|nr:hypothetical protein [Alphaproteobacteria bacterium]MBU0798636.1 hypothetical protein [Alphaproteobacteria bacterium]MBU0885534.1 hypothetical protein [Alphaproteobacteria bacterium]MBU1811888.1 hypothetical protein [Alphaproteobacteria bacterium]MBU2089860.1 hypothetical protein [Alphaproteobacteria bacterium]
MIFQGMERELFIRGVPGDKPINEATLPAVRTVLENATDDAIRVLRDIASARGDMDRRAGRRLFKARYEQPARRRVATAIGRVERQMRAGDITAQPVTQFLADAIKEALNGPN